MSERKFIFSVSPGHTGSTFLADLLAKNIPESEIHHEILGYDRFGVDTPDVSHMTLFNSQGNVQKVREFWSQKSRRILAGPKKVYGEMSHLLVKAGLMENLGPFCEAGEVFIIDLRRDVQEIVCSLRKRFDFLNKGNMWLWHLDPNYPKKLVDASRLGSVGVDGVRLWYVYEMFARAEYYRKLFENNPKIHFVSLDIVDLSSRQKTRRFFRELGFDFAAEEVVLPQRRNVSGRELHKSEQQRIRNLVRVQEFDPVLVAARAIERFGVRSLWEL